MGNNAVEDTAKKRKLEEQLRPDIIRYNNKVIRRFIQEMATTGNIFDLSVMELELEDILLIHYNRTAEVFSDNFGIEKTEGEDDNIALALFIFFREEATRNSNLINKTTTNNMLTANAVAGEDPLVIESHDKRTRAIVAGRNLERILVGRISNILTSETQLGAESAKLTEAQVLAGVNPSVTGGSSMATGAKKRWVTVGDDKVREAHIAADGQLQDINRAFNVGGERLMVPRDRSLGATAANYSACRCSAEYIVADLRRLR